MIGFKTPKEEMKDTDTCEDCKHSHYYNKEYIYCDDHQDIFPITTRIWCALFERGRK